MNNRHFKKIVKSNILIKIILGIAILSSSINPTKAFVPYVYQPSKVDLSKTGISVGKTALRLIHLGQTKEAIRLADLAVQLNPEDDRLWAILAEAQLRNNDLTKAELSLVKAKKLNPKKAGLWFAEASIALRKKEAKKAVSLINHGLTMESNNAGAYFQLGNARIMQKKLALALKAFQKASNVEPKFWEALNNQGLVLYELGKTKQANIIWKAVLQIKRNPETLLALATSLHTTEPNNKESINLVKEALAENPNYVWSRHQAEQLWGAKLQEDTHKLLSRPELSSDVERAIANSDGNTDS